MTHADERDECAAAYEQTQRLQQKSELVAAADEAARCARPSCPALLKDECGRWATEIRAKLPSLVVRVRGVDGCERADARVAVAGGSRHGETPDDVWYVDPGSHEIKVTDHVSGRVKTQTINFAQGERRDIDVDFAPPDVVCHPQPAAAKTGPFADIPKLSLILAGVSGGLLLAGAASGLIGASKRSALDDCKPNCPSDRIDAVRPFFIAGDVLAGLGILVLGSAAVAFFAADSKTMAPHAKPQVSLTGRELEGSF
jgi:hypothetical protein